MPWKTLAAIAFALPLAGCATYGQPPANVAACPETREWQAWINAMPGPDAVPTLIVTAKAYVPPRMEISLEPGALDRAAPPTQRFTLHMDEGSGPVGWQGVRAEVRPAQREYRAVVITCEGEEIARIEDIETVY